MQTSVTGLNKGRNAAGMCDKRLRKENTASVSTSRVILEPAVTEQGESDMEIKIIKLDMITLLCLVFPPAPLFMSRHFFVCLSLLLFPEFPGSSGAKERVCSAFLRSSAQCNKCSTET